MAKILTLELEQIFVENVNNLDIAFWQNRKNELFWQRTSCINFEELSTKSIPRRSHADSFFSFCKNLRLKSINYHIYLISLGNSHPLIGKSDLAIQPLTLAKQISPNRKILLLWEIVREAKWSWVHSPQGRNNFEVKFSMFFHSHKFWKVILNS